MLEKSNVIRPSGIAFSLMTALRNHCQKNHKLWQIFVFKKLITSIQISAPAAVGEEKVCTQGSSSKEGEIFREDVIWERWKDVISFLAKHYKYEAYWFWAQAMMRWLVMALNYSQLPSGCHSWCYTTAFTSTQIQLLFHKTWSPVQVIQ